MKDTGKMLEGMPGTLPVLSCQPVAVIIVTSIFELKQTCTYSWTQSITAKSDMDI